MLFTKIWTAILAVLATLCLAGMYLLSTGASGQFTSADETAVRAVTEAGMAALASDINSSPVSLGPSLLSDTRLKQALDPTAPKLDEDGLEPETLQDVFYRVANEGLLQEYPQLSVAVTDKSGNILARVELEEGLMDELVKQPALSTALNSDEPELMTATVGGKLHAVKLSRTLADGTRRRLVTIRAVELGGGSFFRRVVAENPGGLVRDGAVLGDPLGGAKPEELVAFVDEHMANIPPEGASTVYLVGSGGSARLGSAARVPGPAGKGKSGTLFVVLSQNTLGSTEQDMATALTLALDSGGLAEIPWALVGGLLVISLVLTFYLPHIEYNGPLRRLTGEFNGITEGRQHEVYHDTYGGELGKLARSTVTAMEALRVSWENELMDSDAELDAGPAPARRTRGTRSLRSVRGRRNRSSKAHKVLATDQLPEAEAEAQDDGLPDAIDLPGAAGDAKIERHAAAESPAASPLIEEAAPPPAFHDEMVSGGSGLEIRDSADSVSLFEAEAQDRESYYRAIYDEFVETKVACGENTDGFTYEKFAKKLRKQSDTLLARAEVTDVQFSVYVKDGKAALKAKVIKG